MTLSVCMITADPPERVRAILEPLRGVADEIVLALDASLGTGDIQSYAALADTLYRIEFRLVERHLPWLYAQCHSDWILRLDGDELLSAALLRRLPELIADRAVRQYWIARRWLYPDAEQMLDELPWSVDFLNCLVRNDGALRFGGVQHLHALPATPCAYVQESIYHLELLLSDEHARRTKAVRYEVERPHLLAAGGERINEAFYLPERRSAPRLRKVPAEDRLALQRALAASAPTPDPAPDTAPASDTATTPSEHPSPPRDPAIVSLAELDRYWEGRAVNADAYAAHIEPYESDYRMAPGEVRPLFFNVRNDGQERWPWALDQSPPLRLAYRWLHSDGSPHTPEGMRSPFPRTVEPGESVLTPLLVAAPDASGRYTLEVDVVHEDVRWFGRELRVPVEVTAPTLPAGPGTRLRSTAHPRHSLSHALTGPPQAGPPPLPGPPQAGHPLPGPPLPGPPQAGHPLPGPPLPGPPQAGPPQAGPLRIPRVFHRIWLGGVQMPPALHALGETWTHHHPNWELRLWSEADLPAFDLQGHAARARRPAEIANLLRYAILARHGGIYVDTDFECLRSIEPLLGGVEAFTALELPGRAANGLIGCVPDHPLLRWADAAARTTVGRGASSQDANGPYFFSLLLEQSPDVTLFDPALFYPYLWDEPERRYEVFPDAYAVHHWGGGSWLTGPIHSSPVAAPHS